MRPIWQLRFHEIEIKTPKQENSIQGISITTKNLQELMEKLK